MSEAPESSTAADQPVEVPETPAQAEQSTEVQQPEGTPESRNETLSQETKTEPAAEEKPEAENKEEPPSTMTVSEYVHQLDPKFLTPDIQEELDRISGISKSRNDDDYGYPAREDLGQLAQGPSFDSSPTANRLRELIYGDGENLGLLQNRAKLLSLKKPVDYERTLVKEYLNEKEQLEKAVAQQYQDLVALADHYFNDPAKYKGPIVENNFQPSPSHEVTITMIIERIWMPEEAPEPEELLNPSRIPARSS